MIGRILRRLGIVLTAEEKERRFAEAVKEIPCPTREELESSIWGTIFGNLGSSSVSVDAWIYWHLDRDGNPVPDFTLTPHLYPHTSRVRIPVPEDVQKCMAQFSEPATCLLLTKFGQVQTFCDGQPNPNRKDL